MTEFKLDGDRVYNPDVKERFLESYDNIGTRNTIAYVFYASKEYEEKFNRDLYTFNRDEIKDVIHATNPLTKPVATSKSRYISSYIDFCTKQGFQETGGNINPFSGLPTTWYDQFVDKSAKLYLSKDEIDEIEKDLVNAQDAVLLYLLFEGVFGTGGSEVLNLKKTDIDFENNILHVEDDELGERDVEVSSHCMTIIKSALQESVYKAKNGKAEKRNAERPLIINNYVLRNAKTRSEHNNRADKHLIYRRISTMSDYFSLPYLTSKVIERSGMLYYCYKQIKEGKYTEINNDLLKEIGDKFGMKKSMINGELNYNFYLMREYINPEVITSLYDDIEL